MHKKAVCNVILFLVLIALMSVSASAVNILASDRFTDYNTKLFRGSFGEVNIYFSVTANDTMDVLGASKISIQRHIGTRWSAETTLTADDVPEMQTSNAFHYSATIPYEPIYPNAEYRAVVTFYAEDSNGSSTAQATTK